MRAVNLLPKDAQRGPGGKATAALVAGAAAPVLAGCLVAVGYLHERSSVRSVQGELTAVQAEVARLTRPQNTISPVLANIGLQQSVRRSALDAVLADRVPWDRALTELARVIPHDVWLTSLSLTSPTPADTPAPVVAPSSGSSSSTGGSTSTTTTSTPTPTAPPVNTTAFTIQGYARSQDVVAQMLTRLQLLPFLSGVTLGSSTQGGVNSFQFTVSAAIVPTGGAPAT